MFSPPELTSQVRQCDPALSKESSQTVGAMTSTAKTTDRTTLKAPAR